MFYYNYSTYLKKREQELAINARLVEKQEKEEVAEHIKAPVRIKAAGGISSIEDAEHFIELGADRLGTSRIVKIIKSRS